MRILFFITDILVFFLSLAIAIFIRQGMVNQNFYLGNLPTFIPLFIMISFILWLLGFYNIAKLRKTGISFRLLLVAMALSFAGAVMALYFVFSVVGLLLPKTILVTAFLLYFAYFYAIRKAYAKIGLQKQRVIFFGQSPTIDDIKDEMKALKSYTVMHEPYPSQDKNYNTRNLDAVIIGSKLFAQAPQAWPVLSKNFIAKNVFVDTDFNVYERLFKRISRESVDDDMWLMRGIGSVRKGLIYDILKQLMDLTLALLIAPFLLILGIVIYVLILVIDKHSPMFVQERVGYEGKNIKIYKFRTIDPSTQEKSGERITKLGHLLRQFRLDEIPQIINVLNGSLVL